METREAVLVATGATRISEVPEPGMTFPVKDKRLVVSASGRQNTEQQEYVCLRKVAEQMQSSDSSCLQSADCLCVLGRAAVVHHCIFPGKSRLPLRARWGALPAHPRQNDCRDSKW